MTKNSNQGGTRIKRKASSTKYSSFQHWSCVPIQLPVTWSTWSYAGMCSHSPKTTFILAHVYSIFRTKTLAQRCNIYSMLWYYVIQSWPWLMHENCRYVWLLDDSLCHFCRRQFDSEKRPRSWSVAGQPGARNRFSDVTGRMQPRCIPVTSWSENPFHCTRLYSTWLSSAVFQNYLYSPFDRTQQGTMQWCSALQLAYVGYLRWMRLHKVGRCAYSCPLCTVKVCNKRGHCIDLHKKKKW